MNLADYRRFVSYIYAYRNGKKEKNTGFAKVEARKRNLRISIQLEAPENRETSLDAYGFIRKGEKNFGIFLGEMQKSSGPLYFLKVETDTDNIKGSGHSLNQFSGLWIKGEAGENYITIWNDEPVKRMDLEIEMEEEEQERIEPVPAAPEVEFEKPLNGVRAQEAELIAGLEASETDLPETDLEPDEACVPEEIMSDPAAGESPNDREQEVKASGETGQEAVQNQASDQEKKRRFLRGGRNCGRAGIRTRAAGS